MKRVLSIQDLSCLGRCSMTVTMPTLSAMGIQCIPLPTAVLSTHTAFPDPHVRDLTGDILPTIQHWQSIGAAFDAICVGYLSDPRQAEAVQQVLEEALSNACGENIVITGASRTDAGVHALGQACHFDTRCRIPPEKYPFVLNTMLPRDIRVLSGREVPADFHARFMTCGKTYTYRIINSRHGSAIKRNTHVHIPVPMDLAPMQEAAATLLGTHDYAAFQASGGTAKTTIRTITRADIQQNGDEFILTVEGDAFLYNMVRIIAGTLIEIGQHRRDTDAFLKAYETLDRLALGVTAPPHGLELTEVRYPEAAYIMPENIRWHQDD